MMHTRHSLGAQLTNVVSATSFTSAQCGLDEGTTKATNALSVTFL